MIDEILFIFKYRFRYVQLNYTLHISDLFDYMRSRPQQTLNKIYDMYKILFLAYKQPRIYFFLRVTYKKKIQQPAQTFTVRLTVEKSNDRSTDTKSKTEERKTAKTKKETERKTPLMKNNRCANQGFRT